MLDGEACQPPSSFQSSIKILIRPDYQQHDFGGRIFVCKVHLPQTTLLALAWRIGAADKR